MPDPDSGDVSRRSAPVVRGSMPATPSATDGGRARFDITPDQVWQAHAPPPPPTPAQESRAFFAPLLRVAVITAALLYGSIALGFAAWAWLH